MNTYKLVLQTMLACVLPCLLLAGWTAAPRSLLPPCAGTGLSGDASWIACSGSCPASKTCRSKTGNDGADYKYCACCPDSGPCEGENPCCHLVARSQTLLGVRGLCTYPDCNDTGGKTCQVISNQPVCATPPPPGG